MPDEELVRIFELIGAESYQVAAFQAFGDAGLEAVVELLNVARKVLSHVPFETLTTGLEVVLSFDPNTPLSFDGGSCYPDLAVLEGMPLDALTVVVLEGGNHQVWDRLGVSVSGSDRTVTYRYVHNERETIEIEGNEWGVNKGSWPCAMGTPTFSRLEAALDRYTQLNRIPVQCAHLVQSWRDESRLAFAPKPEFLLRRSLVLALSHALAGATVRPEQNQSESRPVDIEVTWWDSRRAAIIEIKWLGASGPIDRSRFTSTYPESRAIEGLQQLSEYLDFRDETTSETPVIGYLFVFDARRKGLTPSKTAISREDGLFYRFAEPAYPQELLARPDMGRPYRCFLEPVI